MNTNHDYIAQLLHEERASRLRGDAVRDRLVRSVAREGKSPRGRRRTGLAVVVPLRRTSVSRPEAQETQPAVDRRSAS